MPSRGPGRCYARARSRASRRARLGSGGAVPASLRDRRTSRFERPATLAWLVTLVVVGALAVAPTHAGELPGDAPGAATESSAPGLTPRATQKGPSPLAPATQEPPPGGRSQDPLVRMLKRVERYLAAHEVDGVVLDSRYALD